MTQGLVLDTSALLAVLLSEPGGEVVAESMASGQPILLSTVNLAETIGVLHRRRGLPPPEAAGWLLTLDLEIVPFDQAQAIAVGAFERELRGKGIAFGDRACLALGRLRNLPILTADRAWAGLALGIEVRLIR